MLKKPESLNKISEKLILAEKKIKALQIENKKLKSLAFFDCLTGLYSRRYFENELKKYVSELNIKRSKRKNILKIDSLCLVFCDIHNFKKINDKSN
jgi:GGDEF domain-containing protein